MDYRHENRGDVEQRITSGGPIGRRKSRWRERCPAGAREGGGGERARHRGPAAPSIDNYSFRRVARRGQIPILKRRPERRPGEKCPVPKRYEISGVVSPFVVVPRPLSVGVLGKGGGEGGGRGRRGGGAETLMYARRELLPSDNCPMWYCFLLVATSTGHVSMFLSHVHRTRTPNGNAC